MRSRNNVWEGRRVLVTGHTGFKGAWLALWLKELGARVHGFALSPPTTPSLFETSAIRKVLSSDIRGDVRNLESVEAAFRNVQPEIVFHLAAQPLVRASYQIPIETFATNVMGTAHVLRALNTTASVRAGVIVTTDKCYENRGGDRPYSETEPLGGADPYSASKACAEIVTSSFRSSSASLERLGEPVAIASARSGNVLGGGDWSPDRLVPDCIRSFLEGKPVQLRYPQAVRPWIHVIESLAGYILLAERLLGPNSSQIETAFNFGPPPAANASALDIAQSVANLWGDKARVEIVAGVHLPEAAKLRLDTTKAAAFLGWRTRWSLQETLERTVGCYRVWQSGGDMMPAMVRQLADYTGSPEVAERAVGESRL